jgi:16S rRNA (guanine527-N7)-methyltransferase
MTEEEARDWIAAYHGPGLVDQLTRFLSLVSEENERQNLVARSTLSQLWARHALDSLQLLAFGDRAGLWLDIGTGGGFPGVVVGLARVEPTLLVEPRRKRAEFLAHSVELLGVADRVRVAQQRAEKVIAAADLISARAVAGIEALFEMGHHLSHSTTRWLLPRGHLDGDEVEQMRQRWRFTFHVERSRVDAGSTIAIFDGVQRR